MTRKTDSDKESNTDRDIARVTVRDTDIHRSGQIWTKTGKQTGQRQG
jgi:hypothetical protein